MISHVVFTGHWMGLYHTFRTSDGFDFGCEAFPNDFVEDTPARKFGEILKLSRCVFLFTQLKLNTCYCYRLPDDGESSNFECRDYLSTNFLQQPLPDTCPGLPGSDPVLNYMNYVSFDQCLDQEGEFTCGQNERMY